MNLDLNFNQLTFSFFTNFPDLRKYFKGAEHYTADDVQKSERFAKQGQRILLAVHFIVVSADRPDVIKGRIFIKFKNNCAFV